MDTLKAVLFLTPINTVIWMGMGLLASTLIYAFELSWWLLPVFLYGILTLHELLAFGIFHRGLFHSGERVARIYQWGTLFMPGYKEADFEKIGDLTEGYFNGDFSKTIAQATTDKYDKVIEMLNLAKGHRVLDVGSGLGDFLMHLKNRGIEGTGITISPDQKHIASERGLDIRLMDFRDGLPEDLSHQFDAVIFMGCLEHFATSYSNLNPGKALSIYHKTFESAYQALNPASPIRRIFSTTQHMSGAFQSTLKDYFHCYLLHGHYNGYYPGEDDLANACQPYFKTCYRYDATIDYQYSSIASPHHFGNFKIQWSPRKISLCLLLFLVNPFSWATWLYHAQGTWMWQFGGSEIVPISRRPIKTLWYVYDVQPERPSTALIKQPSEKEGFAG